jgi:hypothetical protein
LFSQANPPYVALEYNFQRWGVLLLLAASGPVASLRRAAGQVVGLQQPHYNFTGNADAQAQR